MYCNIGSYPGLSPQGLLPAVGESLVKRHMCDTDRHLLGWLQTSVQLGLLSEISLCQLLSCSFMFEVTNTKVKRSGYKAMCGRHIYEAVATMVTMRFMVYKLYLSLRGNSCVSVNSRYVELYILMMIALTQDCIQCVILTQAWETHLESSGLLFPACPSCLPLRLWTPSASGRGWGTHWHSFKRL